MVSTSKIKISKVFAPGSRLVELSIGSPVFPPPRMIQEKAGGCLSLITRKFHQQRGIFSYTERRGIGGNTRLVLGRVSRTGWLQSLCERSKFRGNYSRVPSERGEIDPRKERGRAWRDLGLLPRGDVVYIRYIIS